MALLPFALVVFFFMALGAVFFLICVPVPQLRRYALSVALWWAVWGPCTVLLMTLAGLGFMAEELITRSGDLRTIHFAHLAFTFGWLFVISGGLATAVVATAAAWIHQFIVHRFTFALFRIYATVVVAGIGSVLGFCLGLWLSARGVAHVGLWSPLGMLALVAVFSVAAYKGAHRLRGQAPKGFTWITPDEFDRSC